MRQLIAPLRVGRKRKRRQKHKEVHMTRAQKDRRERIAERNR